MTHETYAMNRAELERMLERFARLVGEQEGFSRERVRLWQTMYVPIVLADVGLKAGDK